MEQGHPDLTAEQKAGLDGLSLPWANACVALGYFVTGQLGLYLAIPPGYATAVWPPSGIALAAVLLLGWRVWPGIVLGSFLVNVSTGFDASSVEALLRSLTVPLLIACGAGLQGLGGGWLMRRFGGFPNPLRTPPQVGALFLLGGAAGCVINASWSVAALYLAGKVPLAALPFTWLTWWGGDSIGVFVFTPVILAALMRPRALWRKRWLAIISAILLTFAACVALVAYTAALERYEFKAQLHEKGEQLTASLSVALSEPLHAVTALQAFLGHAREISAAEFYRFTAVVRNEYRGVEVLEWAPRVEASGRAAFEAWVRTQGIPDFRILEMAPAGLVPAGRRAVHYPVTFADPARGAMRAVGLDLGADPGRHNLLVRAADSGRTALSGQVTLVQGGRGLLAAAPAYPPGVDRDQAGFALGIIRLEDILRVATKGHDLEGLRYWLLDETDAGPPGLLAGDAPFPRGEEELGERGLFGGTTRLGYVRSLEVGGRKWSFHLVPTQLYITQHRRQNAWFVLLGGLLAAGLLGAFAMVATGREDDLRDLVASRTATLQGTLADLQASEERYRALFSGARLPMLLIDPRDGAIVDANGAATAYYGHDPLIGLSIGDINILPPSELAGIVATAAQEGLRQAHLRHRLADGRVRDVEVSAGPVRLDGRSLNLAVITDITDRVTAEAERDATLARLAESNAELEQFAYVASHDLRQPLRTISGYLGLLDKSLPQDLSEDVRGFLSFAKDGAKRMDTLIVGLLDYSRIGHSSVPFAPVALGDVVGECLLNLAGAIEEAGAEVSVAPDLPLVSGDRAELVRLFQNLIGNAVKYRLADRPVRVSISLREAGAEVVVAVADNGIGITPEHRERVFAIFQRLVSRADYEGTGIGLAVCRKIATHHGGRVWVESVEGEGSTFLVALPSTPPAA